MQCHQDLFTHVTVVEAECKIYGQYPLLDYGRGFKAIEYKLKCTVLSPYASALFEKCSDSQ